jgi:uncharacterized protein (TIRG00374 family)
VIKRNLGRFTACLKILAKYGLGFALLSYVIWKHWEPPPGAPPDAKGLVDVWNGGVPLQWLPLGIASVICFLSIGLTFLRWYVLVRAQELPFTLPNAMRLGLLGYFWSTLFPGSIGGDAVKAWFLARAQSRRTVAVATVLIDRLIGLWALVWVVAILGSAFWLLGNPAVEASNYLRTIVISANAIVVFTVACWLLLGLLPERRAQRFAGRLTRIPKVGHSAAEFWRAVWLYRRQRVAIVVALLMSVVGHVGFVLTFYYSAQVFLVGNVAQIPSVEEHFLLVPIGMTFQALFPTPGGVGGAELAFGWLYTLAGKPATNGILGSLAQRMINCVLALSGYMVYLWVGPAFRAGVEAAESPESEAEGPQAEEPFALTDGEADGMPHDAITQRTSRESNGLDQAVSSRRGDGSSCPAS